MNIENHRIYTPLLEVKRPPPILGIGDSGHWVRVLQACINLDQTEDINDGLTLDGCFGFKTLRKLRVFQDTHRLEVDGVAGAITWSWAAVRPQINQQEAVRYGLQLAFLGVGEKGGNNKGGWIDRFMRREKKAEPWCVGFATFIHDMDFFKSSGKLYEYGSKKGWQPNPTMGAFVFVKDKKSWSGYRHTAVLTHTSGNYIWVIEGNVRPRKWIPGQRDVVRIGKYHVSKVDILYPTGDYDGNDSD